MRRNLKRSSNSEQRGDRNERIEEFRAKGKKGVTVLFNPFFLFFFFSRSYKYSDSESYQPYSLHVRYDGSGGLA